MRFDKTKLKFKHSKRLVLHLEMLDIAMLSRDKLILKTEGLASLSTSNLRQMTEKQQFIKRWHIQTFCLDWIRDHITGASIRTVVAKWIDPDFTEDVAEGTREFPKSCSAPGSWRNDILAGTVSWVTDFLSMIFKHPQNTFVLEPPKIIKSSAG